MTIECMMYAFIDSLSRLFIIEPLFKTMQLFVR